MRETTIIKKDKTTVTIKSPWMDMASAAIYLKISYNEFFKFAEDIPHKGFGNRRRYHVAELDKYEPKNQGQGSLKGK